MPPFSDKPLLSDHIDFGYHTIPRTQKQPRVAAVFSSVAPSYDKMNDILSFGVHRFWKAALIDWLAPRASQHLVDIAGGTGDMALRFVRRGGGSADIVDINAAMLEAGKARSDITPYASRLAWHEANAESLPFPDAYTDRALMAFGLRNMTDRHKALREAFRILRPGGRFCCLEFSPLEPSLFKKIYDLWSFQALPFLGQHVAGDASAYRYLAESIRQFPPPHIIAEMCSDVGFAQIRIRHVSGGIAVIHSGWKLD